jgi:hypothetical protein
MTSPYLGAMKHCREGANDLVMTIVREIFEDVMSVKKEQDSKKGKIILEQERTFGYYHCDC